MPKIRIAIVGVGNCASSLVQGIAYYRDKIEEQAVGLLHWSLGGYLPSDIQVVAALDIDQRKVGKDLSTAIFEAPNCTTVFQSDIPQSGTIVRMGQALDGVSEHTKDYPENKRVVIAKNVEASQQEIVEYLKQSGAEIVLNYLPVGSEIATRFYAQCALDAGLGFINNIPVFIASDPEENWGKRFADAKLPLIGDDIKSQLGATVTHRVLTDLFAKRGVKLDRTYQLNTGGNTDFLNMLNRERLASKKISKTEAVQSAASARLDDKNIHVGPSDYVPWQNDNKVCFIRMEGRMFGDVPIELEMRLSVQDSPNSAGVAIDTIRCAKLALDREQGGVLAAPSAYFCKHPPTQMTESEAYQALEAFIVGTR